MRTLYIILAGLVAGSVSAQFGPTDPRDPRFWFGSVSAINTTGDIQTWKNVWTQRISHISVQIGKDLSELQNAVDRLVATHGTPQFAVTKTQIAARLATLTAFRNPSALNQLLIRAYTEILKRQ